MDTTLLELVRARRAELEAAQPESGISDEKRIWAITSLSAKAAEGDEAAKATRFARAACQDPASKVIGALD
jgi:hypothetical protein